MKLQTTFSIFLVLLVCKVPSETKASQIESNVELSGVNKLKDEVLERVLSIDDNLLQVQVKSKLVNYLVDTTLEEYEQKFRKPRQDDTPEVPENQDVLNGVRRILQNLFTGNLVGVIQESVSIRSPGPVQAIFADIMGAIFGSNAVKGAGTIGLPQAQNGTTNGTNSTAPGLAGAATATPIKSSNTDPDEDSDENDDFKK